MVSYDELLEKNKIRIAKVINEFELKNYECASRVIPQLLVQEQLILNHTVYMPLKSESYSAEGIGRYLIYDNKDIDNPFSIWAFAIAYRQKTSIHDHKYKGTVTVLSDCVSEKFYTPDEERLYAKKKDRVDRYRFHSNQDNLDSDDIFVHQLKRCKSLPDGISVTLHIYNMNAEDIGPDGGIIDRRNINTVYLKYR